MYFCFIIIIPVCIDSTTCYYLYLVRKENEIQGNQGCLWIILLAYLQLCDLHKGQAVISQLNVCRLLIHLILKLKWLFSPSLAYSDLLCATACIFLSQMHISLFFFPKWWVFFYLFRSSMLCALKSLPWLPWRKSPLLIALIMSQVYNYYHTDHLLV